jgi:hypothetical protein
MILFITTAVETSNSTKISSGSEEGIGHETWLIRCREFTDQLSDCKFLKLFHGMIFGKLQYSLNAPNGSDLW